MCPRSKTASPVFLDHFQNNAESASSVEGNLRPYMRAQFLAQQVRMSQWTKSILETFLGVLQSFNQPSMLMTRISIGSQNPEIFIVTKIRIYWNYPKSRSKKLCVISISKFWLKKCPRQVTLEGEAPGVKVWAGEKSTLDSVSSWWWSLGGAIWANRLIVSNESGWRLNFAHCSAISSYSQFEPTSNWFTGTPSWLPIALQGSTDSIHRRRMVSSSWPLTGKIMEFG